LCFGGAVQAQTVDNSALIAQLQAQIAQLQLQIQQILSKQNGLSNSTAWCHTFSVSLKIEDTDTLKNGEVTYLQRP